MTTRTWAVTITMAMAMAGGMAAARAQGEALTIAVYPRIVRAEQGAYVRVRIEPDERSRSVELAWWSDRGAGGSHLISLAGGRAAVRHEFPIKRLEAGEYEVTAILTRTDGSRVRRATTLVVSGMGLP